MSEPDLIPHLFRIEYRKITAVLAKRFGLEHLETAQDIASDTFLQASETWAINGLPQNPTAWLYAVAKNKAKDYLKRNTLFKEKIAQQITYEQNGEENSGAGNEIDLSERNITDSQLQMMFAICHPAIPAQAQIGLSLNILCGFGIHEIAAAFLTSNETITKRLFRARQTLRSNQVKIEFPQAAAIQKRLETVLITLYLLFNEGYYASGCQVTLRKDVCLEAVRLTNLLLESKLTRQPPVYALLALMSFQASRFDARIDSDGETVLYNDQDETLWDQDLIRQGEHFLTQSSSGNILSKYHLEAGIAYYHTLKKDTKEKWESILQLYNHLLIIEYSPMAALNRTYALSKANGKEMAIQEAEKLNLTAHHLYHALLGELYTGIDDEKAVNHFKASLALTHSKADQQVIVKKLSALGY